MLIPVNKVDEKKVKALAQSMSKEGWKGYPLLVVNGYIALTGSHRIAAAEKAGISPEVYNIDIDRLDIIRDSEYQANPAAAEWAQSDDEIELTEEGQEIVEYMDILASQSGDDDDRFRALRFLNRINFVDDYAVEIMRAED
jgi:ParB-like chromosome segregation protein Spo0J